MNEEEALQNIESEEGDWRPCTVENADHPGIQATELVLFVNGEPCPPEGMVFINE